MSDYAEGPWSYQLGETYNVVDANGGRIFIATALKGQHGLGGRRTPEECAANCRIAAASLELLEALKKSHALLDQLMRAVGGNDKLSGCEEFYRGYNAVTYRVAGQASGIYTEVSAAIAKAEGK